MPVRPLCEQSLKTTDVQGLKKKGETGGKQVTAEFRNQPDMNTNTNTVCGPFASMRKAKTHPVHWLLGVNKHKWFSGQIHINSLHCVSELQPC